MVRLHDRSGACPLVGAKPVRQVPVTLLDPAVVDGHLAVPSETAAHLRTVELDDKWVPATVPRIEWRQPQAQPSLYPRPRPRPRPRPYARMPVRSDAQTYGCRCQRGRATAR